MVVPELLTQAPRLIPLAKTLLAKLLQSEAGAVVNTVEQVGQKAAASASTTVAQTVADAGASQSIFNASHLPDLKAFRAALNGQATPVEKKLLEQVEDMVEQNIPINAENRKQLQELFERVSKSEESQVASPNPAPEQSVVPKTEEVFTKAELEAEVQKRVEEELKKRVAENKEAGTDKLPPVEKIITGFGGIVTGEFRNMNSEVGWLMKAFCKWKGITINEEVVSSYLREFANEKFRKKLEAFIKAKVSGHKDPLSACEGLTDNDKTAIGWAGTLISIGGSTPAWVFDGVALLGTIIDYGAEFMHGIPFLGSLLKLPFGRKFITGVGQFAGRFAKDIQLVGTGARELKASLST